MTKSEIKKEIIRLRKELHKTYTQLNKLLNKTEDVVEKMRDKELSSGNDEPYNVMAGILLHALDRIDDAYICLKDV